MSTSAAPLLVALVQEIPRDGREELRFSSTHPAVWAHLAAQFEPLHAEGLPPSLRVFRRR
jgi:hypothetical protein